jgi:predicted amidohydrolase YtcJ
MHATVIYPARRILTMNRAAPFAEAVAVREGRVLAVGTVEELQSWGPAVIDERFAC